MVYQSFIVTREIIPSKKFQPSGEKSCILSKRVVTANVFISLLTGFNGSFWLGLLLLLKLYTVTTNAPLLKVNAILVLWNHITRWNSSKTGKTFHLRRAGKTLKIGISEQTFKITSLISYSTHCYNDLYVYDTLSLSLSLFNQNHLL